MRPLVRLSFLLTIILLGLNASAQNLWSENHDTFSVQNYFSKNSIGKPTSYKIMNLNVSQLKQIQANTRFIDYSNSNIQGASIEIPMPDGNLYKTSIIETSIWADKRIAEKVGVKTYSMMNTNNNTFEGNISILNGSVDGVFFSSKGAVYIHPINSDGSGTQHIIYYLKDAEMPSISCLTKSIDDNASVSGMASRVAAGDCKSRIFRLAVAATGEYTTWAGSVTQAQSYIAITMNIINAIYKRDLNVTFSLVDNTNVVFTSAASDPYTTGSASGTMLNENQNALTNFLGASAYDVGIVFTRAGGGGIAQLNSVCDNSSKGRGACGDNNGSGSNPSPGPQGQWFNGAVAHELGHMFGATHTFASTNSNCGSNRSIGSSWEPGSGSTLMAYAGAGCGATNAIQTYQDYYFNSGSISQMQNFIATGGTCVSGVANSNVAPSASTGGSSFNIPANTPFVLTFNSTDANNDPLTYTWEQLDVTSVSTNQAIPPSSSNVDGPLFRSLPPASNSTRYFPALSYLTTATNYAYEVLPSVARTMNFRGTVRDNSIFGGCTSEVNVALNVRASTGFQVTMPGWGSLWTKIGNNTATVQWDVAGTNLAPINCSQVDILLSTDGGFTYPLTLASAVANNGSYNVLIPSLNTATARVMVKGTNNVFFNITTDNFSIADALPVTFLSFNARKEGSSATVLEWSTATETNSDKFIVERSSNGIDFNTQIGSIKAVGNSNNVQNYRLKDISPLSKWNYYRLKQVDVDGKITYSKIAFVYFDKENNSFVSVYPNPVKDVAIVDFYSKNGGKVIMEIYDSKGALVSKNSYVSVTTVNKASLNLQAFAKGIYTLKCYSNSELIGVTKVVKN